MVNARPHAPDSAAGEPKPLLPFLQPLYDRVVPLAWPIVRLGAGLTLAVHGWGKVMGPADRYIKVFATMGFSSAALLYWVLLVVEFVGGLCIAAGLFTRFFAAAATIEMAYITIFVYGPKAYAWNAQGGGWEYTIFWGAMCLAIWLRGGGPYSVDRLIKREL